MFKIYILWIAVSQTDRSTVAELQYFLLIFASDAVYPQLLSLALSDVLIQTQEVRADSDPLDVGQHEASLAGQNYWHRIWAESEIEEEKINIYLLFLKVSRIFPEAACCDKNPAYPLQCWYFHPPSEVSSHRTRH